MGAHAIKIGEEIDGKYLVLRAIGSGAMGSVFSARRLALGDVVAIKCIHPERDNPDARERFRREAKAMARIRHPNVVQVFDFGDPPQGPAYLVMEMVAGPTLAEELRERGLPTARALSIFGDIARAVEAGHRRGIVHRDLKPGNVMLAHNDDGLELVKVLDFGLARFVDGPEDDSPELTKVGALIGTSAYMSPEQIENGQANPASDIWALGAMLYELLTGVLPFRGSSAIATIMKVTEGTYDHPHTYAPDLDPVVVEAIAAALSRDPAMRPPTPLAFLERMGLDPGAAAGELAPPSEPAHDPVRVTISETLVDTDAQALETAAESSDLDPIYGRRSQLDSLREELASSSRSKVVLVHSETGMGRTALLAHFLAPLHATHTVFRGRFYTYEGDRPPAHEVFRRMLTPAPGARQTMSIDGDEALHAGIDKWQAFEALAVRFRARTNARRVVLALDDLHAASGLELEFLIYLLRTLEDTSALFVLTARSADTRPASRSELSRFLTTLGRQSASRLRTIVLPPVGEEHLQAWIEHAYPGARVSPIGVRRLLAQTGGNPHFLRETLRHLELEGKISRDERGWQLQFDNVLLPDTVAHTVVANLAGLDPKLRQVIDAASVVGEGFRFETLAAVTAVDPDELEAALEEAIAVGLLSDRDLPQNADYQFCSPAVRAVVHDALPRRRRQRLHAKVVDALLKVYGDAVAPLAPVLALHLAAIGDHARTLSWAVRGAALSLNSYDADAADACLSRAREAAAALAKTGHSPPDELTTQLAELSGVLHSRLGRHALAAEELTRAVAVARKRDDPRRELELSLELADAYLGMGELHRALAAGTAALGLATQLDAGALAARARIGIAHYHARLGEYEPGLVHLDAVLADDSCTTSARARALRERGFIQARRGEFAAAEADATAAGDAARRCRDPLAEYGAVSVQAIVLAERGDPEGAIPLYRQALSMTRRLSLRRREMIETANLSMSLADVGRLDEALAGMLRTRGLCAEMNDKASLGDSAVAMAQVLRKRGDYTEAIEYLEIGRELCDETGRAEYAALADLEIAEFELEGGNLTAASRAFDRTLERFAVVQSASSYRAHLGRAQAHQAVGEMEQAAEQAATARKLIQDLIAKSGAQAPAEALTRALGDVDRITP